MRNFPKAFYDDIAKYYQLVRSASEIVDLPAKLTGTKEFGFSPLFSPQFIDVTARRGMFPMALDFHREIFAFAPKCHVERAYTSILEEVDRDTASPAVDAKWGRFERECFSPVSSSSTTLVPQFDIKSVGYSSKLAKKLRVSLIHRISLETPNGVASAKKVGEALQMVFEQHSENWLCKQLRACVGAMMKEPEAAATTFVFLIIEQDMTIPHKNPVKPSTPTKAEAPKPKSAVERKKMKKASKAASAKPTGPPETLLSQTSPLIACEIGYIVGDIYTSYTGAYTVSGTGSISLAATAKILSLLGVRTWDLGMQMEYKEDALGCATMTRPEWLDHVQMRVAKVQSVADAAATSSHKEGSSVSTAPVTNPFLANKWTQQVLKTLEDGVSATMLFKATTIEDLMASPPSTTSVIAESEGVSGSCVAEVPLTKAQQKKLAKEAFIKAKKEGTLSNEELERIEKLKSAGAQKK